MPLFAYPTTTSAIPLVATGVTITTVPASPSSGVLGRAWDVTKALQPNLTVDPINGATGGRTAAEFAAIDAAVRATGTVVFQWSGDVPEFATTGLAVLPTPRTQAEKIVAAGATAPSLAVHTTRYDGAAAGNNITSALANGTVAGQRKSFVLGTITSAKTVIITPVSFYDGTTITLSVVRDGVVLEWDATGAKWFVVSLSGSAAVA